MKKGFTLIELLAVIAILAIIMIIATPRVMDAINDSKLKTYNSTKKLIEKQAEVYLANNVELLPENIGEYIFISSNDLKNGELLPDSIYLPSTGESANDFQVRVLKETNGTYKYDFYPGNITQNGLVAWYETKFFKNDDATPILKDISGNGYDGTLHNFAYTETSGKTKCGSLKFDGVDDYITLPNLPKVKSIELKLKINHLTGGSHYIYDARTDIAGGWIYLNGTGSNWIKLYVSGVQQPSTYAGYIPRAEFVTIYLETDSNYDTAFNIFSRYTNNEVLDGELYSIKIYNRALTETEIVNNYYANR